MADSAAHPTPDLVNYVDAEGVEIHAYHWAAVDPIASVHISHGVGEHALRYDAFARALANAGFAVYADDHRGHGETGRAQHGGDLARLGKLGPGGLRATEAAIEQFAGMIRSRHAGLPLIAFAHSWGSLMAQRIINRSPHLYDAVVLSGTAFRTVRFMESGALNARWQSPKANGFEWLSRDPATAAAFIADPLCFDARIPKLFGLADAARLLGKPGPALAADVPILIIGGSDDPLSKSDGLERLAAAYRARGVLDVALRIYPEARHELLNEFDRDIVTAEVITWMLEHVGGPRAD